ncbi:uncharacterized protein LOC132271337 [Cornus florida]|uniref:uncharacterized protein LOC132271337 n=1 Tax=Cornus florida TaxID=4283 RepID=UPI0028968768|nr:uncharacterized protein LOC132271337 [Cornus florida]
MASSSTPNSSSKKYPFPLGIKVTDIFSFKLSGENYVTWKPLMIGLIKSQGLIGFINGEVSAPPKRKEIPWEYGFIPEYPRRTIEIENPDYEAWERTDALLRSWILGTVSEDLLPNLVRLETVKDMWTILEEVLTPKETTISWNEIAYRRHLDPLTKAAREGDWRSARGFLRREYHELSYPIFALLNLAIVFKTEIHFVEKVLEIAPRDALIRSDSEGFTALHYAAMADHIEAAKLLVEKNPILPNHTNNKHLLPVHYAAMSGRRRTFLYLWDRTNKDMALEDDRGAILINGLILGNNYDIALSMINSNPELAWIASDPALKAITLRKSSFRSGAHLNLWQRFIYSYAPPKMEDSAYPSSLRGDNENPVNSFASFLAYVKQKLNGVFWKLTEMFVPQMKYIREIKREHTQARQLVKHLCQNIEMLGPFRAENILEQSLIAAAKVGISEVVEEIFAIFPEASNFTNVKGQNWFHIAILNRHENVFNLIYQVRDHMRDKVLFMDLFNTSYLDLVACLKSEQIINIRAGAASAAIQMQRELLWYEEVEKLTFKLFRGPSNYEIASRRMVFSETHEQLIKEGEVWMKHTANSCIIVTILIITIVFAAAITVPGGNNSDGHPIFYKNKAFLTFGISDAVAFFSSTSSLLTFLSILTSRYTEENFLKVLPRRLIIGLITLFISIISMVIAFGAILYLVFGDRKPWILAPITALACVPGIRFVSSQFPLLFDMVKYTYRIGVFCKQSDCKLFVI